MSTVAGFSLEHDHAVGDSIDHEEVMVDDEHWSAASLPEPTDLVGERDSPIDIEER